MAGTRCTQDQAARNGLCYSRTHEVVTQCEQIPLGAHPMAFDLLPGEAYYQPAGWLHTVTNLGETVMLNQWLSYDAHPQVFDLL